MYINPWTFNKHAYMKCNFFESNRSDFGKIKNMFIATIIAKRSLPLLIANNIFAFCVQLIFLIFSMSGKFDKFEGA